MTTFQVQCWSGGRWREPNPWPKCVQTVECQKPPTAPPAGSRNGVEDDPWISRFDIHKCLSVYKVDPLVDLRSWIILCLMIQEVVWELELWLHRWIWVRSLCPLLQWDCQHHLHHGHSGVPVEQTVATSIPWQMCLAILPSCAGASA